MQYQTFFLAFLLMASSHFASATTTTTGTNTRLIDTSNIDFFLGIGTRTEDTGMPQVIAVDITPRNVVCTAGDSIKFSAETIYDTGKVTTVTSGFTCSGVGQVTDDGIFTSSLVGRAVITNWYNSAYGSAEITVLPSTPIRLQINPPRALDYGTVYPINGLFPYQILDRFGNEVEVDNSLINTTIKRNEPGNLLSRLINNGGSGISQYVAMLRPVLINGYVSEGGNCLFFERGTYTITAKYKDMTDSKEFVVDFAEPYRDVEAWSDYHMIEVNLDTRVVTIDYDDVSGVATKVICLRGEVYDNFYNPGLLCKFKAICDGHYEVLRVRQELFDGRERRAINKVFMGLIAPQGASR